MAVSVWDVRVAIGDTGRLYPPTNEGPQNISQGNGTQTTFSLPTPFIEPSSLTVYLWSNTSTQPTLAQVPSSAYTLNGNTITFNTAPLSTQMVAARYSVVGFQDSDIQTCIARMTARGFATDDITLLAACAWFFLGAIISDTERMKAIHQERYTDNPSQLVKDLVALRKEQKETMEGRPLAGKDVPAYGMGSTKLSQYQTPGNV